VSSRAPKILLLGFAHTRYVPVLAILVCGVLLAATRAAERFDLWTVDSQFKLLRAWSYQSVARDIVVVGIDEATIKAFPEPIALWHTHLARFLAAMAKAKPAVVGIDIVLPDRSFETVLPDADRRLLQGLLEARRAYPLVLALTVDDVGRPRSIYAPFLALAGEQGRGYALFPVDRDGRVRRFDEQLGANSEQVPTLSGQMARHLGIEPRAGLIDYWRGAPLDYLPLHKILQWLADHDQLALEKAFRGKPVLLGMVLPYEDRLAVPVPLAAWDVAAPDVPGVLLHAQALRTMLGNGPIATVPSAAVIGLTIASVLLWWVSTGVLLTIAVWCTVAVLCFAASLWLLAHGWFLPISAPVLGATLALGGRNALDTLEKLRERRRLRRSFSGYVSPDVMEEIIAGRVQPELGGSSKFVCVMFSDIRGYTTRSEGMTPEQIIGFLNRYFEEVVALIHARGGSVISFMGDGIMAVFGAPKPLDHPCSEAFEATRAMLRYVAELNEQFRAEGIAPIEIGIGLHAGVAVIGHVGSSVRHDYTAIGDVTNVASRLEGLTKEAGYRAVVSKMVADEVGEGVGLRFLGPMAIKGHTPVEVYGHDKI
jgi:adenylate cyclase